MKISPNIHARDGGPIALRLLRRDVESVVTVVGSFDTEPDLTRRDDLLQELTVELLDKGTVDHDRFELAKMIEDRGASISFSSSSLSVHFLVRCLKEDADDMLKLLAEQLATPRLDEEEFQKAKRQMGSRIRRGLASTSVRAGTALKTALFEPGHPNYDPGLEADLAAIQDLSLTDVKEYHAGHFNGKRLVVCGVGDMDVASFGDSAVSALSGFVDAGRASPASEDNYPDYDRLVSLPVARRIDTIIADRNNLDLRMGAAVDIRRDDPDFVALHVANFILGGNFSARLMSYVREEKGLTYGIGARLSGFERRYGGYWQISVSLSRENLDAGIEATQETLEKFVAGGVTAKELEQKQRTIEGLYKVGLSTTRGLADSMHGHYRNGFKPSYIDEYPEIVNDLTVNDVNASIGKYLDDGVLVTSVAGTV